MMSMILFSLAVSLACSLVLLTSPLLLGLWVLMLAFSVAMALGVFSFSWMGLLMFLIYVGGLLVMFSYFVALAPNQMMTMKSSGIFFFFTLLVIFYLVYLCYMLDGFSFSDVFNLSMPYLLVFDNIVIFVVLSLVLFFALVAVVKICSSSVSPLRPFSSYV